MYHLTGIQHKTVLQILPIYTPIYDKTGFKGILGAYINTEEISKRPIFHNYLLKNLDFILLSEKNKIIYFSDKKWLAGKDITGYQGYEKKIFDELEYTTEETKNKDIIKAKSLVEFGQTGANWKLYVFIPLSSIENNIFSDIIIEIILGILILIVSIALLIVIVNNKLYLLEKISEISGKLKIGELQALKKNEKDNEITKIYNNLIELNNYIKKVATTSVNIAVGQYSKNLELKSPKDKLSISINNISQSIRSNIEKEEKIKKDVEIQIWLRKGRYEIAKVQRLNNKNLKILSENIIRKLIKYSDASLGGIYIYNSGENPTIEMIAAYAYGNKKNITKKFVPGEGLVGVCAIEQKKIFIKKIPQDYLKIASGLGNSPPKSLLILPVKHENKLTAIIEMAFFHEPEKYKIDFLEQLSDNIGSWIAAAKTNMITSDLLKKSQEQTKKLIEKENQLNENLEIIRKSQEKEKENSAQMKGVLNALNNTIMTVEYTPDGILLNANDIYLKTMARNLEQIKGVNVINLVKDQKSELAEIMEKVKNGHHIKQQVKRYSADDSIKWLNASYTPFYNASGEITKILFFAIDITKEKLEREKLEEENKTLKQEMKTMNNEQ